MTTLPPIIHRDDRVVVFDKPAGLLSVPGIGEAKRDSLAVRAATAFPGARIVHRLDRDTSGVIVLAFDEDAHRELSRQFHDREVEKIYIALVAGEPTNTEGTIDLPMRKDMDPANAPRQVIDHEHGRRAVTQWKLLEKQGGRSRLELKPITGRSHQLRLHLKELGHPILGDDLYAHREALAMADRLMLHALSLSIAHPTSGAPVTYRAECPF